MHAQEENTGLTVECKVVPTKNGYFVTGPFCYFVFFAESTLRRIGEKSWNMKFSVICGEAN